MRIKLVLEPDVKRPFIRACRRIGVDYINIQSYDDKEPILAEIEVKEAKVLFLLGVAFADEIAKFAYWLQQSNADENGEPAESKFQKKVSDLLNQRKNNETK